MATRRVKRPFAGQSSDPSQRQITSFFDRTESDFDSETTSTDRPSFERRPSAPLLPPSVQANLLAVGMRVRKSVPEGYKTGKEEMEAFVSRRVTPVMTATAPMPPVATPAATPLFNTSYGRPTARELTPFCGLHKIGGLGVQSFENDDGRPMFDASLFEGDGDNIDSDYNGYSEPPSLTSSQETVSSTASSQSYQSRFSSASRFTERFNYNGPSTSTRKRVYGQEEDSECASGSSSFFHVHEDAHFPTMAAPTSSTMSINGWLTAGNNQPGSGRRVLAVPRSRQTKSGEQQQQQSLRKQQTDGGHPRVVRFLDQENVGIVVNDFGEADFLDSSMIAQGNGEHDMEMGGM